LESGVKIFGQGKTLWTSQPCLWHCLDSASISSCNLFPPTSFHFRTHGLSISFCGRCIRLSHNVGCWWVGNDLYMCFHYWSQVKNKEIQWIRGKNKRFVCFIL
jgi:hypothetical protein